MILRRDCILTALAVGSVLVCGGLVRGGEQARPRASWSPGIRRSPQRTLVRIESGQTVPVIRRADVVVVGSSLDGCFLAERIAAGRRAVAVTSAGTSLPREIAMALRPWLDLDDLDRAPDDVKSYLESCQKRKTGDEIILNMIKATEGLEDRLLDRGVGLYYDLHPCGVRLAGRRVTAVLFACKGGLVAIEAKAAVDCTPDARLAALAGAEVRTRRSADAGVTVRYSMLCEAPPRGRSLAVRGVGELLDGAVLMHGDFAEFRVRLDAADGAFEESAYGLEARRIAGRAAAALRKSRALKGTTFARGGDVVLADPTRRIVSRSGGGKLSLDACRPKGVDNLLICGAAADVDDAVAGRLVEPLKGPSLAELLAGAPWEGLCEAGGEGKKTIRLSSGPSASGAAPGGRAKFVEIGPVYRTDAAIPLDEARLPVAAECDVLVVGAGTSGAPAAMVAAENGAETIAVEKYGDVGGTHTIGGVCKYWFGRETDFVRRLDAAAAGRMAETGMPKCMGMLHALMKSGAHLLTHCLAVGAVVDGRTVVGAVVVTPEGLKVIRARRVVDATGDGDVVARAGAATDYGTRRDAMTLWYSFGRYRGTNPEAARHFDCVVDPRDPTDMTRAMISSRRRGAARGPDDFPQYYLTPRESRHVRGGRTVTVADILARRRFEDVVLICKANFDIKGIADGDLYLSGYVEPGYVKNHSVQIPYRALRPVELENILVVGKAYSITHDALGLARMQRDLMAMGGAAGLAAARAVRNNEAFSAIDVKALQKALVSLGVLSQADLRDVRGVRDNELPELSGPELRRMVDRLAGGTLDLEGQIAVLMRPKRSIPLLREALAAAGGEGRLAVARALCFLADPRGADVLLGEIDRQLQAPGLPPKPFRMHHASPDHGYAPEVCFLINSLGRLGDARVIPHMTEVARRVKMNPAKSDVMFDYVFSVCHAAERLGKPACVKALTILADKPGLRGGVLPRGTDPRKTASRRADRYAYLELCAGRALARCGARHGYDILLDYLRDTRGFLARSAHEELVALSGRDLGYDASAWRSWLSSAKLSPRPRCPDDPLSGRGARRGTPGTTAGR